MFTFDPNFNLQDTTTPDTTLFLEQIGLAHSLKLARFAFSKPFRPFDQQGFINDFFNDEEVRANFALPNMSGQ